MSARRVSDNTSKFIATTSDSFALCAMHVRSNVVVSVTTFNPLTHGEEAQSHQEEGGEEEDDEEDDEAPQVVPPPLGRLKIAPEGAVFFVV